MEIDQVAKVGVRERVPAADHERSVQTILQQLYRAGGAHRFFFEGHLDLHAETVAFP
jgi:hypothetical protein